MTDRLAALLAEAPGFLERASHLDHPRLPVPEAFEDLLPDRGLRPGTITAIGGAAATSLALALIAEASADAWTAFVGMPHIALRAASELGIDLDRLVVVAEPNQKKAVDVLAAVIDAFDIVVTQPMLPGREARRIAGRVRERDAVVVTLGDLPEVDVRMRGANQRWHGIANGYGHLAARTVDVTVLGRRSAAQPKHATIWLPDHDGDVSVAQPSNVVKLAR